MGFSVLSFEPLLFVDWLYFIVKHHEVSFNHLFTPCFHNVECNGTTSVMFLKVQVTLFLRELFFCIKRKNVVS